MYLDFVYCIMHKYLFTTSYASRSHNKLSVYCGIFSQLCILIISRSCLQQKRSNPIPFVYHCITNIQCIKASTRKNNIQQFDINKKQAGIRICKVLACFRDFMFFILLVSTTPAYVLCFNFLNDVQRIFFLCYRQYVLFISFLVCILYAYVYWCIYSNRHRH